MSTTVWWVPQSKNQIVVAMPLSRGLACVVARAIWARRLDVANFPNNRGFLDNFDRTFWKRAPVAGSGEQAFDRSVGRSCWSIFRHMQSPGALVVVFVSGRVSTLQKS